MPLCSTCRRSLDASHFSKTQRQKQSPRCVSCTAASEGRDTQISELHKEIDALRAENVDLKARLQTIESEPDDIRDRLSTIEAQFDLREVLSCFERAMVEYIVQQHQLPRKKLRLLSAVAGHVTNPDLIDIVDDLAGALQSARLPANNFAHARPDGDPALMLAEWLQDAELDDATRQYTAAALPTLMPKISLFIAQTKSDDRLARYHHRPLLPPPPCLPRCALSPID